MSHNGIKTSSFFFFWSSKDKCDWWPREFIWQPSLESLLIQGKIWWDVRKCVGRVEVGMWSKGVNCRVPPGKMDQMKPPLWFCRRSGIPWSLGGREIGEVVWGNVKWTNPTLPEMMVIKMTWLWSIMEFNLLFIECVQGLCFCWEDILEGNEWAQGSLNSVLMKFVCLYIGQ